MELSQFTDYSLRALIYVGLREGERCSVKEVAEAFDISRNHMVKIVHNLSKLGYLDTRQGRGGGICLNGAAAKINIGSVVRELENMAVVECIAPRTGNCCIYQVCELQGALRRATDAFLRELDGYTLSDLTDRRTALRRRLGIPKRSNR